MRTRLFLRTAEFLWQEGHTAHETSEEAVEETLKILGIYSTFAEEFLAIPVLKGLKTDSEKFAGALDTYCIEALMQDGKALQAGTSHFLGQNFAKAFDVKYASREGREEYVWATSWGVSTRLMGALVMAHSDDNGLVLPPKLAPQQVVIIPIYKTPEEYAATRERAHAIKDSLKKLGVSVKVDDRDTQKPGWKFAEYELKGVPLRLAIGPRDMQNGTIEIARRDTLTKEVIAQDQLTTVIPALLDEIQRTIYNKAFKFRAENTFNVDTWDEFLVQIEKGGFISAHWDGDAATEKMIQDETKATIRCIPLDSVAEAGLCVRTGKPSVRRVIFARSY
jgi:prolyl-tRNA synthetase